MEQLEIIIPGGQKLSVRDFVEWEYNGGKADFQPNEHYPLWGTVHIEDKLRYIAISVFGDLASYGNNDNRIGVTDGESEHYFYFTVQGKDEEIPDTQTFSSIELHIQNSKAKKAPNNHTAHSIMITVYAFLISVFTYQKSVG